MNQSITLYNQQPGRDAVYVLKLIQVGELFEVIYQNGRRGDVLKDKKKTEYPVPYEVAKKAYDATVKSKMSGGYQPGVDGGTTLLATEQSGNLSGITLQLLNAITRDEAHALNDNEIHFAQPKYDGQRLAIRKQGQQFEGINRKTLIVPLAAAYTVNMPQGDYVIDCEDMGSYVVAFDLLELDGLDFRTNPYESRLQELEALFMGFDCAVRVIETARTPEEKRALFAKVEASNGEGIVLKKRHAQFSAGRPNKGGDQLKCKFVESCTAIVSGIHSSKRSVSLSLLENATEIEVGNVTIPPNHSLPITGDLVEVEYLYAYLGGSLIQPVYKGKRNDIEREACQTSQLKYKPEVEALAA